MSQNKVIIIESESFQITLPYQQLKLSTLESEEPATANIVSNEPISIEKTQEKSHFESLKPNESKKLARMEAQKARKAEMMKIKEQKKQERLALQETKRQERIKTQQENQRIKKEQRQKQIMEKREQMKLQRQQNKQNGFSQSSNETPNNKRIAKQQQQQKRQDQRTKNMTIYADQLSILHSNGFKNDNLNLRLLAKHNGNHTLVATAIETIRQQRQQKKAIAQ